MKSGTKLIVSCLLAAAMVVPTLASCANTEDENPDVTQGTNVTDKEPAREFPEQDFGGETFKFIWYGSLATDYADEYIWSDGVSGSVIGDAVIDRNRAVEEKYKVKIEAEENDGPQGEARALMQAGQCDIDVIYDWGIRTSWIALDGLCLDFFELDDYIDLEQSYWVPSTQKDLVIGDRLFITTNMISMNSFAWASLLFFNQDMIKELNMTVPYDYVEQGTWTYDQYLTMCEGAAADLDGDGLVSHIEDRFAQMGDANGLLTAICRAANTNNMLQMNDDGTVTLVGASEACSVAYETYNRRLRTMKGLITINEIWDLGLDLTQKHESGYVAGRMVLFGDQHSLFLDACMDMTKEMIDEPVKYGVIPQPVYKAGDPFTANVDSNAPMFSIPVQVDNPELVGMVMEYMAYESEQILLPAYYETTVKTRRMDDPRDYDMLDIIRANTHQDWTGVYLWNTSYASLFGQMVSSGHFASVFKKKSAKVQEEINEVIDKIISIAS